MEHEIVEKMRRLADNHSAAGITAACNREPKPGPESSGVTGSSSGATGDTTTATEISSDVSQSDSSGGGDASATGSTKKPGGSKKPDTSTTTKGGGATKRPTTSQATKVFKVEDYGAKGDGKTDDGMAVANAVLAAAKDGSKEKIVQFKAAPPTGWPPPPPATASSGCST